MLAIARKGPRLFDLFDDLVSRLEEKLTVISERALPFISFDAMHGEVLPVVDDVVIYGSTMRDIVDYLKSKGVEPRAHCLVYDIEKASFSDIDPQKVMSHDEVVAYSHQIPAVFSMLGTPYDVDHPILFVSQVLPDTIDVVRKASHFIDIASPLQKANGIANLVSHIDASALTSAFLNASNVDFRTSISKVRMVYNAKKSTLCIEPILACELIVRDVDKPVFSNECLDRITDEARKVLRKSGSSPTEQEEGFYRLLVYLLEYVYGLAFLRRIRNFIDKDLPLKCFLRQKDVNLLFGDVFGKTIIEYVESNRGLLLSELPSALEDPISEPQIGKDNPRNEIENRELYTELFGGEDYRRINEMLAWDDEVGCLWNICRLMHEKDKLTRLPDEHIPNRLKFGFTFEDFMRIIRLRLSSVRRLHLSVAFDYLIDRGVIVPLFLRYPNGYFVRAFRFGESSNNTPEQLRGHYVHDVLNMLSQSTKSDSISQFDFEKLFSYLHDMFKGVEVPVSSEETASYDTLELSKQFDEFGARMFVESFSRVPETDSQTVYVPLIQEVQQNRVLTQDADGFKLDKASCEIMLSKSSPLLSMHGEIKLYVSLWAELCYGRDRPHPRKDDVALLLTTCNTATNFLNAYKVGIYTWFSHREARFLRILGDMKLLVKGNNTTAEGWTRVDNMLKDLAKRLKQCEVKKAILVKAPLLEEKIDNWSLHNDYRQGVWSKVKRNVMGQTQFTDKQLTQYDHLSILYPICRSMMNTLRALVAHVQGVPNSDLGYRTRAHDRLARDYGHLFPSPLQEIGQNTTESTNAIEAASRILDVFEVNYKTLYAKFDEIRQYDKAPELKCEELDRETSILMYDIRGSSDWTPRENERITIAIDDHMKPYLQALGEGKYYSSVLNDENAWVISDVQKALKASQKLLEVLHAEGKDGRIAIHYTSAGNRVTVYKGKQGDALGGRCFIVCQRLRQRAEELQKSRGGNPNVLLLTSDALSNLSEDVRSQLDILGPSHILPQGKSIGQLQYYEITEESLRNRFTVAASDWKKMFRVGA